MKITVFMRFDFSGDAADPYGFRTACDSNLAMGKPGL